MRRGTRLINRPICRRVVLAPAVAGGAAVAFALATALMPARAYAQAQLPRDGGRDLPPIAAGVDTSLVAYPSSNLPAGRLISIKLRSVSLAEALRAISSVANVNFIYRTELLPADRLVSIDVVSKPLSEVLATVLHNTGLQARTSAVGDLFIVPRSTPEGAVPLASNVGRLPAVAVLGQTVATGSMITTTRRELPTSVTVLTGEALDAQGVRTVDQLFRGYVPGIVAFDQGSDVNAIGTAAMQVRGTTGFTSLNAPLKTYVDGIEMSDPTFINHIEAKSIDRIEIALGPQASTLYGSGALSGVMQIFTKRGSLTAPGSSRLRPRATATLSSGLLSGRGDTFAPVHDHAATIHGGGDWLAYSIGLGYAFDGAHASEGYATAASHNRYLTIGTRSHIGSKLPSVKSGGTADLNLTMRVNDRHFGASADQFYAQGIATGQLAYNPYRIVPYDRPGDVQERTVGASFTWTLAPWLQQRFVLGRDAQISDFKAPARYVTTADSLPSFDHGVGAKNTFAYHVTARWNMAPDVQSTMTAGLDTWGYEYRSIYAGALRDSSFITFDSATSPAGGFVANYATRQSNTGVFGQLQIAVRDRLYLTGGLRIERQLTAGGGRTESPYMPRFGVAYLWDNLPGGTTIKLRGAYGRASRAPCPGCRNGSVSPFAIVLPNPFLNAESQAGGEVGADLYVGDRFSFQTTIFQQYAESFIVAVRTSALDVTPVTYQYRNGGDTQNRGVETQAMTRFGALTLTGTYTYTDAHLTRALSGLPGNLKRGDRALFVAPVTGALDASYSRSRWQLSSGLSYVSRYRDFNDEALSDAPIGRLPDAPNEQVALIIETPSQLRLRAGASYDLWSDLRLFARGDNLNNSYGMSVSRNVAGRRVILGMRIGN